MQQGSEAEARCGGEGGARGGRGGEGAGRIALLGHWHRKRSRDDFQKHLASGRRKRGAEHVELFKINVIASCYAFSGIVLISTSRFIFPAN